MLYYFFSLLCPAQHAPTGCPFLPSRGLPEELLAVLPEAGAALPLALWVEFPEAWPAFALLVPAALPALPKVFTVPGCHSLFLRYF